MYEKDLLTNVNGIVRDDEGNLLLANEGNGWGASLVKEPWIRKANAAINEHEMMYLAEEVKWRGEAVLRLRLVSMTAEEIQCFLLMCSYSPRQAWRYACHCARLHPWKDLLAVCDQIDAARNNRVVALTGNVAENMGRVEGDEPCDLDGQGPVEPPVYRGTYRPAPTDPWETPERPARPRVLLGVWPTDDEYLEELLKTGGM